MNRKLIIPVKKTEAGFRVLKLIMSKADYDTAVSCDLEWLHCATVTKTDENPNVILVWDQKFQIYKLRVILKELVDLSNNESKAKAKEILDGSIRRKKKSNRCSSKESKQ